MDSHLVLAVKQSRNDPMFAALPSYRIENQKDDAGRILVDLDANVTDALLASINQLGGVIISSTPAFMLSARRFPWTVLRTWHRSPT